MSGRLRGDGQIFKKSEFIAHTDYEVQITSLYKRTRNLGGMFRVFLGRDIKLRVTPNEDIAKHVGEMLTLHFEDSRRLDFILTSPSGDCVASGDFCVASTYRMHPVYQALSEGIRQSARFESALQGDRIQT